MNAAGLTSRATLQMGEVVLATQYVAALRERERCRSAMKALFRREKLEARSLYLAPLAERQYADMWTAKNGNKTGYTDPYHLDRPLAKRIDGYFTQCDRLDRVISVSQVNMEPIHDGSLLLSDHIGVMATLDLDHNASEWNHSRDESLSEGEGAAQ